jgi:hypothetical protein
MDKKNEIVKSNKLIYTTLITLCGCGYVTIFSLIIVWIISFWYNHFWIFNIEINWMKWVTNIYDMNEHQVTSMIFVKNKINNYNLSKIYYNITLKVFVNLISYISSQNFLI